MGDDPLPSWNDGATQGRDRRLRRARRRARAARARAAGGAGRRVRQRRHAVVREADADRARLHPRAAGGDGRARRRRCATASRGRPRTSRTTRWLGGVITKHYHGDDSDVKVLIGGVLQAFAGWTVDDYARPPTRSSHEAPPPDARARVLRDCGYRPMVELLRYLEAQRLHDLHRLGRRPRLHAARDRRHLRHPARARRRQLERAALPATTSTAARSSTRPSPDVFDDGPVKPVRIWSRIGRRPLVAVGNSNGDLEMLQFAGSPARPGAAPARPPRRRRARVRLHRGRRARRSSRPTGQGWTVISVKDDWATVFADAPV